jgi:EF-hand domain-containing family member B
MSTAKVRPDPFQQIRTAGKVIATGGYTADMSIRQDNYGNEARGNLGTPPHIKKFRKTNNMEPGQIIVHPGL